MESAPIEPEGFLIRPEPPPRISAMLLPKGFMNLWVVLVAWVIPQVILLGVNWQAWNLASGDMQEGQRFHAHLIFGAELLALLAGAGMAVFLAVGRRSMGRWMGCIPLAVGSLFLAIVLCHAGLAIPTELADWMLPQDQWVFKQFALVMPAVLLGAFRLLCPDRENDDEVPGFARALLMTIVLLGAAICYLPLGGWVLSFFGHFFWGPSEGWQFVLFVYLAAFMVLSILAAASLLRLAVSIYVRSRRAQSPAWLAILTFLIALAGPIGGLILNAWIPFPFDFQLMAIYVVAAVNGIVLLLPNFANPLLRRLVWLAQCALFPFTLYFFLVFVPFLTLGPLAILILAAGFLMYVPSLLFILHGYRIYDGFRVEMRNGSKALTILLGLVFLVAWPVAYTVEARWDRATLNQALDYLQYPNYSTNGRFTGNRSALRSALFHLRDFKQGFYLPLVSEYYNWLVFDNLVLPQPRLDSLYETYFGEPLPKSAARANPDFFGMASGGRRNRSVTEVMSDQQQATRPSANAVLEKVESAAKEADGAMRVTAKLTLSNSGTGATEYRTALSVPPGVMVSGFWLTIGAERVPGRIFEKRAAMWVYQKITEVRPVQRDPAILRYTGPGRLELSVFPVESHGVRTVEVEFLYPRGSAPDILVGETKVEVPAPDQASASIAVAEDGNFAVVIPAAVANAQPAYSREPYLHVIVDASKNSSLRNPAKLGVALSGAMSAFSHGGPIRVTFANYESQDLHEGAMMRPEEAIKAVSDAKVPFRGGFLADRAVKEILWQQHLQLSKPESEALKRYPQIVILTGIESPLPKDWGNLAEFARLQPDFPGFWLMRNGSTPQYVALDPNVAKADPPRVRIFQVAGQSFLAAAGGGAAYTSLRPAAAHPSGIEVFNPDSGKFMPVDRPVASNGGELAKAVVPWSIELGRIFEPYRQKHGDLGGLLQICRETGILVPSAAYMVVENQAQWKILEQTEKKALKGHEALALSESTPEPGTVALLLVAVALSVVFLVGRSALGRLRLPPIF